MKRLTREQMQDIVFGAVYMTEEEGGFRIHRFTAEQEELYRTQGRKSDFYKKCFSLAGVTLRFKTDSEILCLAGTLRSTLAPVLYSFDVFVDGRLLGYIDNSDDIERLKKDEVGLAEGEAFHKAIALPAGMKTVTVFCPYITAIGLLRVMLGDGATVEAARPPKTLLMFGDSITHGYSACRPSARYASLLSERIGAAEYNKGIGGEIFFPPLAETKDDLDPDYITVAYGTNDWSVGSEEDFAVRCRAFYTSVSRNYPNAQIFALAPIWRADIERPRAFGDFARVSLDIQEIVKDLPNVQFIEGYDLVPEDPELYADLHLHPNDAGFAYYAERLYQKLKPFLK